MTDINAVINETFDAARRYHTVVNQNQLNNNGELKNKWMPILWFGNLPAYSESKLKVVTVGINPSNQEFPEDPKDFRFNGEAINNAYSAICNNAELDIELCEPPSRLKIERLQQLTLPSFKRFTDDTFRVDFTRFSFTSPPRS